MKCQRAQHFTRVITNLKILVQVYSWETLLLTEKQNFKGRISSPSFRASLCSALSLLERHLSSADSHCKRFGTESGPIGRRP